MAYLAGLDQPFRPWKMAILSVIMIKKRSNDTFLYYYISDSGPVAEEQGKHSGHSGYFDFVGEVEEAVSAADAAIIVVSGKAGVQVGTQKAWNLCERYKLPR